MGIRLFCAIVVVLALLPPAVRAQEERSIGNFAGAGVRAMGMGGAYTGVADDFTALYWNPAGLAQIRTNRVYTSVQRGSRSSTADFLGKRASSSLENTRFSAMGAVFPYPVYRGSLVFAAGMMRIKDFDWSLRQQGFDALERLHTDFHFQHQGSVMLHGLAAAVDVSPSLSLGATVGFSRGDNEATNEWTYTDTENLYDVRRLLARDSFDDKYGTRFHAILGAMLRMPRDAPRFRLGGTVAAGTSRKITYTFRGLSDPYAYNLIEFDDGSRLENVVIEPDGTFREVRMESFTDDYRLSLPMEFTVGASYEPISGLLLAASAHYAEWTQASYKRQDQDDFRSNQFFDKQYRNVTRYHLGAEWRVPVIAAELRAGYYSDPLPFVGPRDPEWSPDPQENPEIDIQQDRRFFTAGAGLLLDQVLQLDVAWTRGSFEQIEGYEPDGRPRLTENHTITRLIASVAYRF